VELEEAADHTLLEVSETVLEDKFSEGAEVVLVELINLPNEDVTTTL
jgi:hypothetical protein